MKIVRLESQNVKRIRAVSITPEGNLVVIGGNNAQGKSSVLDSISSALGGKGACPGKPVRKGATKAKVICDLGDLVVTRTFTEAGGGTLTVKGKDGAAYPSPQSMLDGLVGKMTFDPLSFLRESPKRQVETLKAMVGLDFEAADAERADLYTRRHDTNQDAKRLAARVDNLPKCPDVPSKEVGVSQLSAKLSAGHSVNHSNGEIRQRFAHASNEVATIRKDIAALQKRLETAEASEAKLLTQGEGLEDVDTAALESQIATAEATNRKVRDKLARTEAADELAEQQEISAGLTARIDEIDSGKAKAIQDAAFPVDGLAFATDGVLYNGLPFDQASSAEQLRVSVAVGLAMNPKLRVLLIRDGSLLDDDNLRMIAEMAEASDAQVWLERVGEGEECQVIIEDGMVKTADTELERAEHDD